MCTFPFFSSQHYVPFSGLWQGCQGQAGRCDPWLPTEDDLSPHPTAVSGSGDHQRDPKTEIHCRLATVLTHREWQTNIETNRNMNKYLQCRVCISLTFQMHHLALNYSMLERIFGRIYTHTEILKTRFSSSRENMSWLDLKLPNPLWFNTLATHADRKEIQ